jgi:hypothetical protein
VLSIGSSEKIGKELKFFELIFTSERTDFDKKPDLSFESFKYLKLVLNRFSCFLKKSDDEIFCLIEKYSSCKAEP